MTPAEIDAYILREHARLRERIVNLPAEKIGSDHFIRRSAVLAQLQLSENDKAMPQRNPFRHYQLVD